MRFRYNDELLLSDSDQALAKASFPTVFFAMDHPELRDAFKQIDTRAKKGKTVSRRIGCLALICATLSLLMLFTPRNVRQGKRRRRVPRCKPAFVSRRQSRKKTSCVRWQRLPKLKR